ncbi:hypothetical protein [Ferruginibacter sp.]
MKKLLIALFALGTLTLSANAQEKRMSKGKHQKHEKHDLSQKLNFSEEQKKQAALYKESYKTQMQQLSKNDNITVKEYREKKEALHNEQKAKMESLLTAEQKVKMTQMKAEHQAKRQQHDAARMDKMKTKLNLTEAQMAQMKTQHEAMKLKMQAIKQDDKMDKAAKKENMNALKAQMKEENKKIFTADQLKKMEEMKKDRKGKKAVK